MALRGRLIVICGIDGSGKTVQSNLLCRHIRQAGRTVQYMEFPRYGQGFFGELIARYLRGEFAQDPAAVSPYLASLPFACDRWEASPTLRACLAEGAVVVCNRYVSANLAHQGGKIQAQDKRVAFQKWVEELEYDVFGLPRPDLHVWLDMPPEVAVTLVARKADRKYLQKGRDIHESSMAHLRATREVYRQLAAGPGWVTVECAAGDRPLPSEAVAAKVWEGVRQVVTE